MYLSFCKSKWQTQKISSNFSFISVISFTMTIKIIIYCHSDSGASCEVYGSLYVNIGNRAENQNFQIWKRTSSSTLSTNEGKEHTITKFKQFYEYEAFATSTDKITFSGSFLEKDNFGSDTLAIVTGRPQSVINAQDIYGNSLTPKFSYGSHYVKLNVVFQKD